MSEASPSSSPPESHPIHRAPADLSWSDLSRTSEPKRSRVSSRERFVNTIKTLAWVAPLTVLIWVYAEREQVTTDTPVTIPVVMKAANPNRVVRLLNGDNNITASLTGPRGLLDRTRDQILPGSQGPRVQIEVDANLAPGVHQLRTETEVAKSPIFKGVAVTNCVPDQLRVEVDDLIERKIDVQLP